MLYNRALYKNSFWDYDLGWITSRYLAIFLALLLDKWLIKMARHHLQSFIKKFICV